MDKPYLVMKKLPFIFAFFIFLSVSSFSFRAEEKPKFTISIKGLNHDLQEGLKTNEFAKMRIESNDENVKVESFEITLARGNRAISNLTIDSNTFDLRKYKGQARSGDRIVIEIKKLKFASEPQDRIKAVFAIVVN
jgi:hypothetical protein